MLLLYSYYNRLNKINSNNIIIYFSFLLFIFYFSKVLFILISVFDIYIFTLINNFEIKIASRKNKSELKMEIVAEGVSKKETDNLVNTLIEYSEKFNVKNS